MDALPQSCILSLTFLSEAHVGKERDRELVRSNEWVLDHQNHSWPPLSRAEVEEPVAPTMDNTVIFLQPHPHGLGFLSSYCNRTQVSTRLVLSLETTDNESGSLESFAASRNPSQLLRQPSSATLLRSDLQPKAKRQLWLLYLSLYWVELSNP